MKKLTYILLPILLLHPLLPSHAQLRSGFDPAAFPYTLNNYQEAALMALGTGILYASAYAHQTIKPLNEADIQQLNAGSIPYFERWVTEEWHPGLNRTREFLEPSAILAALGTIGGIGLTEKINNYSWYPLMTLTMMYFEGFYIAQGTMLLAKGVFQRPRPYVYNQDLDMAQRLASGNNESFFSGNATVMFYNSTFISQMLQDLYPGQNWTRWVWAGTHSLSLVSGLWSVRSGMHFPSDVLTGALWGSGIAWLLTYLHKQKEPARLTISPWSAHSMKGVALCLTW